MYHNDYENTLNMVIGHAKLYVLHMNKRNHLTTTQALYRWNQVAEIFLAFSSRLEDKDQPTFYKQ